jgi:hypothetical protein
MPREQAGVAAANASTSRQVGSALGVAVIGAAVSGSSAAGFAGASHAGWWIIVGLGAAVLTLGLVTTAPTFAATKEKAVVNA